MSDQTLEFRLRAVMDAFPAQSALYAVDLRSGRPLAAIRPEVRVVSASTIKVPILLCALTEVLEGRLALESPIKILEEDFREDTQVFEPENLRESYSLWELLYWMIVSSDNTATNAILSLLGYDHINRFCAHLGLKDTFAQRKMLDWTAVAEGRNNYTSPADQCTLYSLLYRGEILNAELRAVAMDFLLRNRSFDGLLRYIPDAVRVLHKPGGLDYLDHDAGIFLLEENPYFLGIFTWDGPARDGESQQKRLIGQLSRMVYTFVKEGICP